MQKNASRLLMLCGLVAALMLTVVGTALGQKTTVKGLITGRNGENMIVKTQDGNTVTVTLTDNTKIEAVKGSFGARREDMGMTALVPGLPVEVQGEQSGSQLVATTVKFRASALNTANQIQAGLQPTDEELKATQEEQKADEEKIQQQQQQLAAQEQQTLANQQKIMANQQQIQKTQAEQAAMSKRFGELGDYDTKATATVYFAVNSSEVNAKGKQDLQALATQAKQINAYMIQVAGYTDSSGNAAYNQQLSDKRAADVTAYLQQSCGVPLFRVLAPAAMGTSHAAATNETPAGMSENRRVVVKILVNKGLAGS
jgi:outer membrane protein OmpA-like peptidoglycan-associated protein